MNEQNILIPRHRWFSEVPVRDRPFGEQSIACQPVFRHREWMCRLQRDRIAVGIVDSHAGSGSQAKLDVGSAWVGGHGLG